MMTLRKMAWVKSII